MTIKEAIKHYKEVSDKQCNLCGDEHRQLADWLTELAELRKRQWISVKDRLPKSKTAVLAIVRNKYSELDEWYTFALLCINDNGEWEQFFGPTWRFFNLQYKVSHWMPLPEPPKTGGVND